MSGPAPPARAPVLWGYLFPPLLGGWSGSVERKGCRSRSVDYVKAEVIPEVATLHALRHSFGTHLRLADVNMDDIADLMGHKDTRTTREFYAFAHLERLQELAGRLEPLAPKALPSRRPNRKEVLC